MDAGGSLPSLRRIAVATPIGAICLAGIFLLTGKVYQAWVFSLENLCFGMLGKFNSGSLKSR